MKNKEINYSEEFQDAISRFPKFNSILFFALITIIIVFFVLLQLIKSPEIVIGEARVTAEKPPIELVSQNYGRLVIKKFVPQKKLLKGEYLAVIENPTNEEEVLNLKSKLLK